MAGGKVILVGIEIHFMYRLYTFCVLFVNTMLESGKKKTLSRSYLIQKWPDFFPTSWLMETGFNYPRFWKVGVKCNSLSGNWTFQQFSILSQVTHHKRQEMFREGEVKQGLAVSQAAVNLQGKWYITEGFKGNTIFESFLRKTVGLKCGNSLWNQLIY